MQELPDKVTVDEIEAPLIRQWESVGVYNFDSKLARDSSREQIFSIDTPPPTVSGSLHIGHVFSYTHTDVIARFKRMQGFNVFYPLGFDDNGLPTERRVQNYYGVRPSLQEKYIENFKPPFEGTDGKSIKASEQIPVSRQNFIELCEKLSSSDEIKFKELWQSLGLSIDWNLTYQTIDEKSRRIAQKAFLNNLKRGEAYQMEAPGLWDVTFQTAVAQAEIEAREYPGNYHKVAFTSSIDGSDIIIETTRPELLISCVALIAHPEDKRYNELFGKNAISPVFGVEVPILPHILADPEKGSGIVMCCTFGDQTDIQWWRELQLPMRSVMSKNGRLNTEEVDWVQNDLGRNVCLEINGKTTFSAREIIVQNLRNCNKLIDEPTPTLRMTNFFEKGDKPLEIVASRQWYIKNGGKDAKLNAELLDLGNALKFVPSFMKTRYDNWVSGLNNDWLISRQRFFGVAFPIWYGINENGDVNYNNVITPNYDQLPIDPLINVPSGYNENQRGMPNGFIAESDVMDTWATSSLTPQIACNWEENVSDFPFEKVYPMDLRPQGQDIIRTWLFSTVLRAHLEEKSQLPWKNAAISGWILDPDRKKMSKSKGNVITPMHLIDQYGADAVRYWASSAKLGTDATFDEGQMKIGRRLAMKVLNVSKFVLNLQNVELAKIAVLNAESSKFIESDYFGEFLNLNKFDINDFEEVDLSVLNKLREIINVCTESFEKYEHSVALSTCEQFFWEFCDDYVELVKRRAYNQIDESGALNYTKTASLSAKITLFIIVRSILKLLAPFIPFTAETAWSWFNNSSIHKSKFNATIPQFSQSVSADLWQLTSEFLNVGRREKTNNKVSMNTPIDYLEVETSIDSCKLLKLVMLDLKSSLSINELVIIDKNIEISDEKIQVKTVQFT